MQRTSPPRSGRALKRVVIVLAVVLVLALAASILWIDSLARAGLNAAATHALGTKAAASSVSIGLFSGESSVHGFEVDNPQGFSNAKILTLDALHVSVGMSLLFEDAIVIDRVALSHLTLNVEKSADGTLNINALAAHLQGANSESKTSDAANAGDAKEVLIKELRLESVQVNLHNMLGGNKGVVTVRLPDLVLRDLSSKGGVDLLASEVSGVVLGSVVEAVIASNIEGLGAEVIGGLRGAVNGFGAVLDGPLREAVTSGITDASKALQSVGKSLGDATKKVLDGAGKAIEEGVGGALEGIFGGKKP